MKAINLCFGFVPFLGLGHAAFSQAGASTVAAGISSIQSAIADLDQAFKSVSTTFTSFESLESKILTTFWQVAPTIISNAAATASASVPTITATADIQALQSSLNTLANQYTSLASDAVVKAPKFTVSLYRAVMRAGAEVEMRSISSFAAVLSQKIPAARATISSDSSKINSALNAISQAYSKLN